MKLFIASLVVAGLLSCTNVMAADICCDIVSKDLQTGIVTARDIASGRVFKFRVTNQQLLDQLNPGTTFGRTSVTGLAVSPEELEPDWVDTCCYFAPVPDVRPEGMNKGEIKIKAGQFKDTVIITSSNPNIGVELVAFSGFENTLTLKLRFTNAGEENAIGDPSSGSYLLDEATGKKYRFTTSAGQGITPAGGSADYWVKYTMPEGERPKYLTAVLYGVLLEHMKTPY